ncbi:MAG: TonB family protein [Rhizomicrobium sp.]
MQRPILAALFALAMPATAHAQAPVLCDRLGANAPVALTSHLPPPELYPPLSAMMGETGMTMVRYSVEASGDVGEAGVARSSGSLRLDDAAIAFVKGFKFKPATVDGKPAACVRQIGVQWALHEDTSQTAAHIGGPALYPAAGDFPSGALAAHEEGTVDLIVMVDEKGTINLILPMTKTRFPDLNAATVAYLGRQKIVGPTIDGSPVRAAIIVRVVWSPTGKPPEATASAPPAPPPAGEDARAQHP